MVSATRFRRGGGHEGCRIIGGVEHGIGREEPMDSRLLTEIDTAIRQGTTEERQALLLAVAAALASCGTPAALRPPPSAAGDGDDRLLSMPEVAAQLGIPRDRAYDLGRQGRLPVVSIGKYRRVRQSAVTAFLKRNESAGLDRRLYTYSPRDGPPSLGRGHRAEDRAGTPAGSRHG
jgi:excisionase family DNA binding protein